MNAAITLLVAAIKLVALLLGGLVTLYAYRAYRRTASRSLLAMAVGFGSITLGTLVAGFVDRILPYSAGAAVAIEGLFMIFGFLAVLYSLHA